MNAYLQRADDFIQQQIYKFEQKKQGREYTPMPMSGQPQHHQYAYPPRSQTFNSPPPQGPPPPEGWTHEFDQRSQRWYYLERSTGRSQWDPPAPFHRQHASTFNDASMARRLQEEEEERARGRQSAQFDRPQSGHGASHLGVPATQQRPASTSPHPSPHGRLPPGAHLDMKTGEIVYNIYPRDHPINNQ